jgi:DNA repair protein RecN (Recombination protein N)
MLLELEIRDLAIFASARAEFGPGLTCLTGETGAGKSVFLSALRLLRGERADGELVRKGSEKALVGARVSVPEDPILASLLSEIGAQVEDGELVLSREVQSTGRSRARVGGANASLKDLQAVTARLFDLHGQHAEQRLLARTDHAPLLAHLAGKADLLRQCREAHQEWKRALERARSLREQAEAAERNREFLEFQHRELDEARLVAGEEEELERRLAVLSQAGQIADWTAQARQILSDSSPLEKQLALLARHAGRLGQADPALSSLEEAIAEARRALADAASTLDSYEVPEEADPAQLDRMNARLARIQKLKARHKTDHAGLVALRDRLASELRLSQDGSAEADALERDAAKLRDKTADLGAKLRKEQEKAAKSLDREVTERLQQLGMEGAAFRTRLDDLAEPGPDGSCRAVFELCPNPGEGWRDLSEVASGGEASRIMLAIESRLAAADPVPLLVFDEVDAGLSGTVAHRVGEALRELARDRQVVAITHLHQVAAVADRHHSIAKSTREGRTFSEVRELDRPSRVSELSRMLGRPDDPAVRAHAESLLAGAA